MSLTIVRLYHDLLGTYGDQGNAEVLVHRAQARGIDVELVEVTPHEPVPTSGDIYLLGGGEDGPQTVALEMLRTDGGLTAAVNSGASVFAVCAGFQLIGTRLPNSQGRTIDGLGLVDVETIYTDEPRCVGELVIRYSQTITQPIMTGFENHQGRSVLGAGVTPLGHVLSGIGNGRDGVDCVRPEGVHVAKVFGTYMHGPALVRNPALADAVLEGACGPLAEYVDEFAEALAAERRTTLWP